MAEGRGGGGKRGGREGKQLEASNVTESSLKEKMKGCVKLDTKRWEGCGGWRRQATVDPGDMEIHASSLVHHS